MTTIQIESALSNIAAETWNRVRSETELRSFIVRRALAVGMTDE